MAIQNQYRERPNLIIHEVVYTVQVKHKLCDVLGDDTMHITADHSKWLFRDKSYIENEV